MKKKKNSRRNFMIAAGAVFVVWMVYSFRPRPVMVDMGQVVRAPMEVTIAEEARTQVRDTYVVASPIAGRLLRVEVEPGDTVEGGVTIVARMLPLPSAPLDVRARERALAAVSAAEAGLRFAHADLKKAAADEQLAEAELKRTRTLRESGTLTASDLERAERGWRVASAALETAKSAIAVREAELAGARAQLIGFDENRPGAESLPPGGDVIAIRAPVSGRILRVIHESESVLGAGTPVLEIGNTAGDLEVLVELLSTDAVQVSVGDRVLIEKWGGGHALHGKLERVDPWGYTKYSALGVEEQRVHVIIKFTDALETRKKLGHGFRVEARIVVWEVADALTVPSSALFRDDEKWAVFSVDGGRARLCAVEVGHNNGRQAEIINGLRAGEEVILYPAPGIGDGTRVALRRKSK